MRRDGGLAQLGERLPCKQEVSGSIPLISTNTERTCSKNKIATQRSGRDFERKNYGVSELWTLGRSERYVVSSDEGQ